MDSCDVIVIGGGPAGATAGRLLAEWGHSVLVLKKPEVRQPSLAESLPPSCRKLFGYLGILERIDAAGFYRTWGNTVWWGTSEGRQETFAGGPNPWGYQVLRSDLDRLLLDIARETGAKVYDDAVVRRARIEDDQGEVEFERPGGRRHNARARFVLDCSGRAGVIARKGLRKKERRYATLAVVGVWRRNGGWRLEDETHTLVETYVDGWAWSVPLSPEERYFTVMVDYRDKAEMRPAGLKALYHEELGKTAHFKKILDGATRQGSAWSCDASLYSSRSYAGPAFLLIGDAASFVDPLSSFGVKKAVMSAWLGAVTVNTCLTRPQMLASALDFYSARETRLYASYLRQSALYFREAAERYEHRFWIQRALLPYEPDAWEPDEEELRRDPDVIAAFQALKEAPSIRLEEAGDVTIEQRPGTSGREIVLEEAVVSPGIPAGVRFLGGVNLPRLLQITGEHSQVPELFEAYCRVCPPVEFPNFLGALSVMLAKGIVINRR